jgi:hypothetical protein
MLRTQKVWPPSFKPIVECESTGAMGLKFISCPRGFPCFSLAAYFRLRFEEALTLSESSLAHVGQ